MTESGNNNSPPARPEMPVLEEYAKLAPVYDTRWSSYVQASVEQTLARVTTHGGEKILDVGCGTGVLLSGLHQRDPSLALTGVDPVEEMLAVARRRLPDGIMLLDAWADELPFENASFGKVICSSMFHYLREPHKALAEFSRVLMPRGQLVITDWCGDYAVTRLLDIYLRLFNAAHHKAYTGKELLELLHGAGYEQAGLERYRISWQWGLMTATAVKI